jgi:hypothetical protein
MAMIVASSIEHAGYMCWRIPFMLLQHPPEHGTETMDGACWKTIRSFHWWKREEGAEYPTVGVNEMKAHGFGFLF